MKRILITGANSYVGTNVEKWLMKEPDKFYVETLDMKNSNWKDFDFSNFDVVFHVAGIVHVSAKKGMKELYIRVNRDLAIETAEKAKTSGVKHFIFMSTLSLYGNHLGEITINTIPKPNNIYGETKYQADVCIQKMSSSDFHVFIVRPPMIYGYKSPGNFSKLIKVSKLLPFFPNFDNRRSMIYITNFAEYIKHVIDSDKIGIGFPQNSIYVSSSNLIKTVSKYMNKKMKFTSIFNWIIKCINLNFVKKIFGDLFISEELSFDKAKYNIVNFDRSIEQSINGEEKCQKE